jgi:hypothetical protein
VQGGREGGASNHPAQIDTGGRVGNDDPDTTCVLIGLHLSGDLVSECLCVPVWCCGVAGMHAEYSKVIATLSDKVATQSINQSMNE